MEGTNDTQQLQCSNTDCKTTQTQSKHLLRSWCKYFLKTKKWNFRTSRNNQFNSTSK